LNISKCFSSRNQQNTGLVGFEYPEEESQVNFKFRTEDSCMKDFADTMTALRNTEWRVSFSIHKEVVRLQVQIG